MKLTSWMKGNRSAGAIVLLFAVVIGFAFYSSNANIGTFSITLLSGLLRAMLLFLVAAGLSLIFGLMDILNFAQGAYFMIGAYVAYDIQHPDMGFLNFANGIESPEIRFAVGILFAILVGAALGWVLERVLLRPLYSRPLFQLVLTFGVSIILLEAIRALWGTTPFSWTVRMGIQDASFSVFGSTFSVYRLFVIVMGLLVMAGVITLFSPGYHYPRWRPGCRNG
jgi:branched-chain amino acid transport system permease protein